MIAPNRTFLPLLLSLTIVSPAIAQLTPDTTLGTESSLVTPNTEVRGLPADLIQGGATRGANLYHSFSDFNIGDLQRVYFANPAGIESILTRVTGTNPGTILGTLGVDGAASLFLLNPHGILFGPNANLDIAGSFTASTAGSLQLPDGSQFSATNPQAPPLLTVAVTPGLQTGNTNPEAWLTNPSSPNPLLPNSEQGASTSPSPSPSLGEGDTGGEGQRVRGDITNQGNLTVGAGQTLTLYGNTVISNGTLTAPGGTVQVLGNQVGLFDQALVDVSSPTGGGTVLIGGDFQGQGTIPTARRTYVGSDVVINADATSLETAIPPALLEKGGADGGTVIVWADETTRFYGTITARGGSFPSSNGGFVEVSGKEYLDFQGWVDTSAPFGQAGTLLLDPTNIEVVALLGNTFNTSLAFGDAPFPTAQVSSALMTLSLGNIVLQATNNITVNAGVNLLIPGVSFTAQAGNNIVVNNNISTLGGAIRLIANDPSSGATTGTGSIAINNAILTTSGGDVVLQAAGDISLNAITGNALVQTTGLFGGDSGDVTVQTNGTLRVQATSPTHQVFLATSTFGAGNAGDMVINAGRVEVGIPANSTAGGLSGIATQSQGAGKAGDLTINTQALILQNGVNVNAANIGSGDAGNITLVTQQLTAQNGSVINASGRGNAGDIVVQAQTIDLQDSAIGAIAFANSTGNAGKVDITSDRLNLQDGGWITVQSSNNRDAGEITIQAREIALSGTGRDGVSRLTAEVLLPGTGNGGAITIDTTNLLVQNGAQIDTNSPSGNAGNQTIRATEAITLLNGGNFSGASITGNGGIFDLTTKQFQVQGGFLLTDSQAGNAGNQTIRASDRITFVNGGTLSSSSTTGLGGNISLETGVLQVQDSALVTASLSRRAGNVSIQASQGANITNSLISSFTEQGTTGDMQINTTTLALEGSAVGLIATRGQTNTLQVTATDSVTLNQSTLSTSGVRSGSLFLNTGDLRLANGSILSASSALLDPQDAPDRAGIVRIQATGDVVVTNSSSISANAEQGAAGSIQLDSRNFTVQNTSTVTASTLGGNAGTMTIRSQDSILFSQASTIGTLSTGVATGGDVAITATNLTVDAAGLITSIIGDGQGGNLAITVQNLTLQNQGTITTSIYGRGTGGDLTVQADAITLTNRGALSTSSLGAGEGGDLAITTNTLTIQDFGTVNTSSFDVTALEATFPQSEIDLLFPPNFTQNASLKDAFQALLNFAKGVAANSPQGNAGTLVVQAKDIVISTQGSLSTASQGITNGGALSVQTDNLAITDGGILSSNIDGTGRGGDITVRANNLVLNNQGIISSRGEQQGAAANIALNLTNTFNARDGLITATSFQAGGGNINLQAEDIRLQGSSLISTSVFDSTGGGGNITINSTIFLALNDSDILANAELGPGGNITINSPGFLANLFGTGQAVAVGRNPGSFGQFRGNGRVDISAASAAGVSGVVTLPNLDISRGLIPLPEGLGDAADQIAQACRPGQRTAGSFINIGRGGIPETPYDFRGTDEVWEDLGGLRGVESGVQSLREGVDRQEEVKVRTFRCRVGHEQ